jgi:hypothetical protein
MGTKQWGRANRTIEAAMNYVTPGVTWDTLSSIASTWDTLPEIPWDSQSWQASGRSLAIFDTSHNLKTLTGSGENSGFTTGDTGDDSTVSFVKRVRLRFFSSPTTGTVTGQTRVMPSAALSVTGGTGTFSSDKFDIRQAGKWHRFSFLLTGSHEVAGIDVEARPVGGR